MNKPVLPMSSLSLRLPNADRSLETYRLAASRTFPAKLAGTLNRVAFSAAHVVADPLADVDPWLAAAIDWDRTIAFREHVWDLGLGVAEAMDTAQRGMGLDWPTSLELITRSVAAGEGARQRAGVFRRRHRSPRGGRRQDPRRRDPRLRGADRRDREGRRPDHPDGVAGAGKTRPQRRRLRQGL